MDTTGRSSLAASEVDTDEGPGLRFSCNVEAAVKCRGLHICRPGASSSVRAAVARLGAVRGGDGVAREAARRGVVESREGCTHCVFRPPRWYRLARVGIGGMAGGEGTAVQRARGPSTMDNSLVHSLSCPLLFVFEVADPHGSRVLAGVHVEIFRVASNGPSLACASFASRFEMATLQFDSSISTGFDQSRDRPIQLAKRSDNALDSEMRRVTDGMVMEGSWLPFPEERSRRSSI